MTEPSDIHYVVVNHEQQYSIWPTPTPPAGWTVVGPPASREECLDRIEQLWTDMRPLSLREFMAANPDAGASVEVEEPFDEGPDLVSRLCSEQELELELFGGLLRERIEQGVVHVRFPGTRGGTLLAVELDADSKARAASLANAGALELSGTLQLDFVDLRLQARVEIETLRGRGQLIRR